MTAPPSILSLESDAFIAARPQGVPADEALRIYRDTYRTLTAPPSWAGFDLAPIGTVLDEGPTTKFTQRLPDGLETESVILPQEGRTGRLRRTLCVSSQVGCAMGCTFCETAQMGLMRQLTAAQIVGQWFAARTTFDVAIDNIVFMGMGEPMDNLDAVEPAIRVLADRNGAAVSPSRITVSTVGHIGGIARLARLAHREGFRQLRLAVSLNAPNDDVRSAIMPINRAAPMAALKDAMREWPVSERTRILIEYVLIPGVNDDDAHAAELAAYLADLACTLNVIPYNPRRDSPWPAPTEEAVDRFVELVRAKGQRVTRRRTMGRTVMGACGQLGNAAIRRRRFVELGGRAEIE